MIRRISLTLIPRRVQAIDVDEYIVNLRGTLQKKYPHAYIDIQKGRETDSVHMVMAQGADMQEEAEAGRYISELLGE
jgi:hypothetical protein